MSSRTKWVTGGVLIFIVLIGLALFPRNTQKSSTPTIPYQGNYVALGDSVAAGVGLTGDSDPSACDRTTSAYPSVLAMLYAFKTVSIACSGAEATLGVISSQTVNNLALAPQLQNLFSLPKPKLITLTVGANDVHWNQIISQCYVGSCNQDLADPTYQTSLSTLSGNLNNIFSKIAEHYGAAIPTVIVTGYYQPLPAHSSDCLDVKNLSTLQLIWLRGLGDQLNDVLKNSVTNFKYATFVPVDFTGHELCSTDSWVQGLTDTDPYHPTVQGQQAIASSISAQLIKLNYKAHKQ